MTRASHRTGPTRRWRRSLGVLGAAAMLSTAMAPIEGPITLASLPVTVQAVQPTDGTTLYVARTVPRTPGGEPGWALKLDVLVRNDDSQDLTMGEVRISYPGSAISDVAYRPYSWSNEGTENNPNWVKSDQVIASSENETVPVYDGLRNPNNETTFTGREHSGAIPPAVHVEIEFDEYPNQPLVYDFSLVGHRNETPTGGLLFPVLAADLGADEYLNYDTRHVVDNGGGQDIQPATFGQRYGLDMGVVRHNGQHWTGLTPDGDDEVAANGWDNVVNDHYLIWDLQLYAMGDGVVTACAKGHGDHSFTGRFPTEAEMNGDTSNDDNEDVFSGNQLVIQMGNERVEYAHLKAGSIPDELCPGAPTFEPVTGLNIPVEAGQLIGRVGNNGNSTAPHIHVHVSRGGGSDGVPFNFLNIRTTNQVDGWWHLPANPPLQHAHAISLPSYSLIRPNPCGLDLPAAGATEYARHGVPGECYQDVVNLAVQRGYRLSYVDAYEDGSDVFFNAVFRPGGVPQIARHGLSDAEFQELFDELTGEGWRLHQVDSYLHGGSPRIAAIFEQRPGPAWAAHHFVSTATHDANVADHAANGRVPVNVSWVEVNGERYWTALFEHHATVTDWDIVTVSAGGSAYQDAFNAQTNAGRVPVEIDVQHDQGLPYITAVFAAPFTSGTAAVHGLSAEDYQTAFDANLDAGRLTRAIAGGDYAGSHRFAAVWRELPDTTITSGPPSLTNSDSATFGFVASDPYASLECATGTSLFAWEPCSSTTTYTDRPEGANTFRVRAVDRESLRDPTPDLHTWFVDTVAPVVTLTRPAENHMYVHDELESTDEQVTRVVGSVTVVAHATDPSPGSGVADVTFSVDGVPVPATEVTHDPVTATWSFLWQPPGPGKNMHTISVEAVDHATNSASTSRSVEGTATGKKV